MNIGTYIAVIILLAFAFSYAYAEDTKHDLVNNEQGWHATTKEGRHMLCLITGEGYGFSGSNKLWVGLTCAEIGVEGLSWRFCKGVLNQPTLICAPPGPVD